MEKLKIFKVHPNVTLPKHQTKESACFDLSFQMYGRNKVTGYTASNKPITRIINNTITVSPGDRIMVPTGLILDIPEGYSVRVHARSGTSLKQGLVLVNAEGVIDSDYTEELMILVHNISTNMMTITNGDRIAQAELVKNVDYVIEETALRPIQKGNRVGGMGSTGLNITTDASMIKITIEEPKNKKNVPKTVNKTEMKRGRGRPKKNASSS